MIFIVILTTGAESYAKNTKEGIGAFVTPAWAWAQKLFADRGGSQQVKIIF